MRFSRVSLSTLAGLLLVLGFLQSCLVQYVQSVDIADSANGKLVSHNEDHKLRKKGRRSGVHMPTNAAQFRTALIEEAQQTLSPQADSVFDMSTVTFDAGMVPEQNNQQRKQKYEETNTRAPKAKEVDVKTATDQIDDDDNSDNFRFQQVERKGGKGGKKKSKKKSKGGSKGGKKAKGGSKKKSKGGSKGSKGGSKKKSKGGSKGSKGGSKKKSKGGSKSSKGGSKGSKGGSTSMPIPKVPAGTPVGPSAQKGLPSAPAAPRPPPPPPVPTIPTLKDTRSYADKVACVGCKYLWEKIHMGLDQSSGYDAVRDSFERTCAGTVDLFYDACDEMFDQIDELIQDYLAGSKFCDMCKRAQICPLHV